jgi:hypothetical protein
MDSIFPVKKRTGLLVMTGISILCAVGSGVLFVLATTAQDGLTLTLQIVAAIILLTFFILALYRVYVLLTIRYRLMRDGLFLRWGLHREEIPTNRIEWVRPVRDLGFHLPLPRLHLPGMIFGRRSVEGLGKVDFIATDVDNLMLVATAEKVYAISPEDPAAFSGAFKRVTEMGSLEEIQAESITPVSMFTRIWSDAPARGLLLLSLCLVIILFAMAGLIISGRETIIWIDGETAPSARLLMLPTLNALIWFVDIFAGSLIYLRHQVNRLAVYILWGFSGVTSLLLILAVIFIVE